MRDLVSTLTTWLDLSQSFALASVVQIAGSVPRRLGSAMAVRTDGLIAGSVSGGCVEGAVVEAALRAIRSGRSEMLTFGPESEAALFEVGLSCGGEIRVWVEPVRDETLWRACLVSLDQGEPITRLSRLDSARPAIALLSESRVLGDDNLASSISFEAVRAGRHDSFHTIEKEGESIYVAAFAAPERLIVIGAVHIAIPLVRLAQGLGMKTVVIDPRQTFARADRFDPSPHVLMNQWPEPALAEIGLDSQTYVVALSHDAKIDDPALALALKSPAAYVGALGGSKTQAKRRAKLSELGVTDEQMRRLHGPIGLDLGAETPEEIALSIAAEIVRSRNGML